MAYFVLKFESFYESGSGEIGGSVKEKFSEISTISKNDWYAIHLAIFTIWWQDSHQKYDEKSIKYYNQIRLFFIVYFENKLLELFGPAFKRLAKPKKLEAIVKTVMEFVKNNMHDENNMFLVSLQESRFFVKNLDFIEYLYEERINETQDTED